MVSISNTYYSITKVYWQDIRERVIAVEPMLAALIDELDPNKRFPLYLTYYPYGAYKGDTKSAFIPKGNGTYYRLESAETPRDIKQHLGYGIGSAPLGLLLEKQMEVFTELPEFSITKPEIIYKPGDIFPFSVVLNRPNTLTHSPNGVVSCTSGLRSVFMLPPIGCASNHKNLLRDYRIQSPSAKRLYDHWYLFQEIAQSNTIQEHWSSCLLYFSENWLTHLWQDAAWSKLKLYLHEKAWQRFSHTINRTNYEVGYSLIQKRKNLKPSPYVADTVKHLFAIAAETALAYAPIISEDSLPLNLLQTAFIESYNLKKYLPIIIGPTRFNFASGEPAYYSLQYPSTPSFSPRSQKTASILDELQELAHLLKIFQAELAKDNFLFYQTKLHQATKKLSFSYFHNEKDAIGIIQSANNVAQDKRFTYSSLPCKENLIIPVDSTFLRGCVAINVDP